MCNKVEICQFTVLGIHCKGQRLSRTERWEWDWGGRDVIHVVYQYESMHQSDQSSKTSHYQQQQQSYQY
uniref:Uncharacterized protein n=1 Tax=Arion vulgaris TaxID=1028688 RepID=A0A0B7A1W8_9EUPU